MRKLWIASIAATMLGSSPALAINTHRAWDGQFSVASFGCPNSSNYGQVIFIPKYKNSLGDFSFWLSGKRTSYRQSMVVRAEVYQWDPVNLRATGSAVFESEPRTISYKDDAFHRETFHANVGVTRQTQYILFLTIDKDYALCGRSYATGMGAVNDGVYTGGTFYYLNSGGDMSQWTTTSWTANAIDLAMKVTMPPLCKACAPGSKKSAPEPEAVGLREQ